MKRVNFGLSHLKNSLCKLTEPLGTKRLFEHVFIKLWKTARRLVEIDWKIKYEQNPPPSWEAQNETIRGLKYD